MKHEEIEGDEHPRPAPPAPLPARLYSGFTARELGFLRLPVEFTTGSSLMPQKRNPDAVELTLFRAHDRAVALRSLWTRLVPALRATERVLAAVKSGTPLRDAYKDESRASTRS